MKYTFDGFTIDADQLCIDYQGQLLNADSRVIRLMVLLIKRSPEAVSQQELLQTLWTGSVVSNWSASRLVADARTFFKERDYTRPIIETLRGRGYRLAPELARRISHEQVESAPAPLSKSSSKLTTRNLLFGIAAATILALITVPLFTESLSSSEDKTQEVVYSEPLDVVGRILWVDDNPGNNRHEAAYFENKTFGVYSALTTEDALTLLQLYNYDVVISDMGRGDDPLAGMRLLESMREAGDDTPFILYTIVSSDAKQQLIQDKGGLVVATEPETLYEAVLNIPVQTSSNRFKDKP